MSGPLLADGYHRVAPGKLACVVTSLEMRAQPDAATMAAPAGCRLRHVPRPASNWYRSLYLTVGQDWLWMSRLLASDADLRRHLDDPRVEVWALEAEGAAQGIVELDFRTEGECELAYFGLAPPLTGRGLGRWMMRHAIEQAWRRPIERFWVHTCTLDDPRALPFYVRNGFTPFRREVEVCDDPRRLGLLPPDAAPDVPNL